MDVLVQKGDNECLDSHGNIFMHREVYESSLHGRLGMRFRDVKNLISGRRDMRMCYCSVTSPVSLYMIYGYNKID
jgi:hypothetical protein